MNKDLDISKISIGNWLNIEKNNFNNFKEIIEFSFENKVNYFDTASSYDFGEESLGYAIKDLRRKDIILSTKYFNFKDSSYELGLPVNYLNDSMQISLDKIKTNYIDIIFMHNYHKNIKLYDLMKALNNLYIKGYIRSWGVSRWPEDKIKESLVISSKYNFVPIKYYQGVFNLFNLSKNQLNFIKFLNKLSIKYIGYSPLARGVLTNKYYSSIPKNSRAANQDKAKFIYDLKKDKLNKVNTLVSIAENNKCTVTQLVMSYLMKLDAHSLLTSCVKVEQIKEVLRSRKIALSSEEENTIKEKFNIYG